MQRVQPTGNNLLTNYGGSCAKAGAAVALAAQGFKDTRKAFAAYEGWKKSRTPAPDESRPIPVEGSPVLISGKLDDVTTVIDVQPVDDSRAPAEETSRAPAEETSRRSVSHTPNQTRKRVAMLAVRAGVSFGMAGYLALSALRGCVAKKA